MILSGKFDGVAATLDKWSKSAGRLDGTLASFEADVNELAAAAAAAAGSDANPSVGVSVGDPVVIQRCKAARASLQRTRVETGARKEKRKKKRQVPRKDKKMSVCSRELKTRQEVAARGCAPA